MTIFSRQINNPGNLGGRVFHPRGGGAPVASWWNPDGATPSPICVGAYQAKAAASYAASKVNLPTPGTFDLAEGNGAVPWGAGAGWGFVVPAAQYFDTGIVIAATTWSVLVQYVITGGTTPFGVWVGGSWFFIQPIQPGGVRYFNGTGTLQIVAPPHPVGNIGMGGKQGYRDGLPDGAPVAAGGAPPAINCFLGCVNNTGAAAHFIAADIAAFAIYNVTLTAPQMLARAAAMALL